MKAQAKRKMERSYKGIMMRKWGKLVTDIRKPNKRTRIWLGSYSTPVAAARAYDTAAYYLRGPTARLNFPEYLDGGGGRDFSATLIRKKAPILVFSLLPLFIFRAIIAVLVEELVAIPTMSTPCVLVMNCSLVYTTLFCLSLPLFQY